MKEPQEPRLLHSALSFGGVVTIVIVGLLWFGISLHSLLLVSLVWVAGNAVAIGHRYASIKAAMTSGIAKGLGAIYIFILIGVLVASLLESGTIGSLIYYGIDLLHPAVFLPAGLLLCTLMSLATGTSWGTIATAGVVLVGLGEALGIPLPVVAGMVISGASFGDKMSPVSDTTVLAAMTAETDIYAHIRSMFYTSGPTYIICLAAFSLLGLQFAGQSLSEQTQVELQSGLSSEFVIGPLALLPLLVLLALSLKRVPAEPSMLASVATAVAVQDRTLVDVLNSLQGGYVANTGLEQLDSLLNRGGIQSMMWTLSLALIALALGGLLDRAGFVRVLMNGILARMRRAASLMTATIGSGLVANMSMGEAYLSIIFGGQLFKASYEEQKLENHLMSRCLEEGATLTTPLIPWTTSGAFCMGVLGVSSLAYAPWALFNYINPLLSIILAYMGFGIFRQVLSNDN